LCNSRTGVRHGKLPMVRRILFCRRCNFNRWVSAANSQAGHSLSKLYGPRYITWEWTTKRTPPKIPLLLQWRHHRNGPQRKRRSPSLLRCMATAVNKCPTACTSHYVWESWGIVPCILDFGTRRRWIVRFMPQLHHPLGESLRKVMNRRLDGLQFLYWCCGEENNLLPPPGMEALFLTFPLSNLVAIPNLLSRLLVTVYLKNHGSVYFQESLRLGCTKQFCLVTWVWNTTSYFDRRK
jgi:hypothetical protein